MSESKCTTSFRILINQSTMVIYPMLLDAIFIVTKIVTSKVTSTIENVTTTISNIPTSLDSNSYWKSNRKLISIEENLNLNIITRLYRIK